MKHPNQELLESLYGHYESGDIDAFLSLCDDKANFQIAGKSRVAGKFSKKDFKESYFDKMRGLDAYGLEVHDIMASDRHGLVLVTETIEVAKEKVSLRSVHVWRIEQGKALAWYLYPRDLYLFEEIWK